MNDTELGAAARTMGALRTSLPTTRRSGGAPVALVVAKGCDGRATPAKFLRVHALHPPSRIDLWRFACSAVPGASQATQRARPPPSVACRSLAPALLYPGGSEPRRQPQSPLPPRAGRAIGTCRPAPPAARSEGAARGAPLPRAPRHPHARCPPRHLAPPAAGTSSPTPLPGLID
eukprot:scaffold1788_cov396-Prasinococcus_capsulatus_cf.AAC.1